MSSVGGRHSRGQGAEEKGSTDVTNQPEIRIGYKAPQALPSHAGRSISRYADKRKEARVGKVSLLLVSLTAWTLAGCTGANIVAAKWDSGSTGANVQTRCEQVDMRAKSEMDRVFAKYDGWKLVYISEYTTANRVGTDGAVCFERPK